MSEIRILQIGPYPIQPRIHGGQRRVGALHDAYLRNGVKCQYVAITAPNAYKTNRGAGCIFVDRNTRKKIHANGWLQDLIVGEALESDSTVKAAFLRLWGRFEPNVVQLEQPFFWPGLQRLIEQGAIPRTQLIYSSQNVEWIMKERIYDQVLPPEEAKRVTNQVRSMESDLARNAELTLAVSQSDADVLTDMGARQVQIVKNGCDLRTPSTDAIDRWKRRLLVNGVTRYAAFVGSAHLPNATGFAEMVGAALDYIPPDARIVVCGGVTQILTDHPDYSPVDSNNRWRLALIRETLSDDDLAAILNLASVTCLPILEGGGSNLKTVEAVLLGKPIVATPFAFRSFEELANRPNVNLCHTPRAFQQVLQQLLLASKPIDYSLQPNDPVFRLTWPVLGDAMVEQVRESLSTTLTIKGAA